MCNEHKISENGPSVVNPEGVLLPSIDTFCIVSPRYISLGDDLVDVSKLVVYNRLEVDEKLFLRPLCCDVSFWIKDKTVFEKHLLMAM
jgi:hypothetical protein